MTNSLTIYTSSRAKSEHTLVEHLIDAAQRYNIVARRTVLVPTSVTAIIHLTATADDQFNVQSILLAIQAWSQHVPAHYSVDLTLRLSAPSLIMELSNPVRGRQSLAAVTHDMTASLRILNRAVLLHHVSRILLTPHPPVSQVVVDANGRAAYLIDLTTDKIIRAPGAGNVPLPE